MLPESAEIKVRALFAYVGGVQHDSARQFLLPSKAPGLLVRNVLALSADRSNGSEPDVVESSQGIPGRWCNAACKRRREQTRSVTQRIPGCSVIDVQRGQPWRLDIVSLKAPRPGS